MQRLEIRFVAALDGTYPPKSCCLFDILLQDGNGSMGGSDKHHVPCRRQYLVLCYWSIPGMSMRVVSGTSPSVFSRGSVTVYSCLDLD